MQVTKTSIHAAVESRLPDDTVDGTAWIRLGIFQLELDVRTASVGPQIRSETHDGRLWMEDGGWLASMLRRACLERHEHEKEY